MANRYTTVGSSPYKTSEFDPSSSMCPSPRSSQQSVESQGPEHLPPYESKQRRPPSITPRTFTRFFTPRSLNSLHPGSSRGPLFELLGTNRNGPRTSPLRSFKSIGDQENISNPFPRDLKRRKLTHTPDISTNKQFGPGTVMKDDVVTEDVNNYQPSSKIWPAVEIHQAEHMLLPKDSMKRIVRLRDRGLDAELLQRSHGSRRQYLSYPVNDWQSETCGFYSRPEALKDYARGPNEPQCIPFCAASCNTNSLVAIGDELGWVKLLESAKGIKPGFSKSWLKFRVHGNAILDMCFSDDDSRLATAAGDQSAKVVDMMTQQTISILSNHSQSLKQVRFQPGANNNNVLATSGRDGSVQIWDLRCKGSEQPVQKVFQPIPTSLATYGCNIGSINDAYRPLNVTGSSFSARRGMKRSSELPQRNGNVSITAINFLPAGQEHLILTASEAAAAVSLWDIRSLHISKDDYAPEPLSRTRQPESHLTKRRHFGICSMSMNSDGNRLYTLCKDNTVYTYSLPHLILGNAPELSSTSHERRPPPRKLVEEGLGPIYGYTHTKLKTASFYVKTAIRKAKDGKSELLAVGSSDSCAIVFPTDERYLPRHQPTQEDPGSKSSRRVGDTIPISQNGTALVRGHESEVGSVAWSYDGDLITVGDDFIVRAWREGKKAMDYRVKGETGGRRWRAGWAEAERGFDGDISFDEDDD
ncbi:hypothetical protein B7494_g6584 [Chlorociboria aeruginascens]|nr:hypothetical protein B7494_g6584 [Chlorociboria aeruginascens]